MKLSKKILIWTIGFIFGGIAGYVYYKYWGCQRGCAITSKPFSSIVFGGILGTLFADFFIPRNKEKGQ